MIGITWISTNFIVFFYFRLFLYFLGKSGLTFDVFKAGIRMSFLKQIQEKLIAGQFPLMWFKKISVLSSWSFTRVMCLDWILVCASSAFYSSFFFLLPFSKAQTPQLYQTLGFLQVSHRQSADTCEPHPVLLWKRPPEAALLIAADLTVESSADRGAQAWSRRGAEPRTCGIVGALASVWGSHAGHTSLFGSGFKLFPTCQPWGQTCGFTRLCCAWWSL